MTTVIVKCQFFNFFSSLLKARLKEFDLWIDRHQVDDPLAERVIGLLEDLQGQVYEACMPKVQLLSSLWSYLLSFSR